MLLGLAGPFGATIAIVVIIAGGEPLIQDRDGHRTEIGNQRQVKLPRPRTLGLPIWRHVPWSSAKLYPQRIDDP